MSSEEYLAPSAGPEEPEQDLGEILNRAVDTLRRRKWYVLVPLPIVVMIAVAVALYLPPEYESEALVGIAGPKVSAKYVAGDATPIAEAVVAMQRQILSRTSLTRIAEEVQIYDDGTSPAEQAARLQEELKIETIFSGANEVSGLHISFTSDRPEIAQRVTARVVTLFVEQNLQSREDQVTSTKSFLSDQVQAAEERLAEQEQRLQTYKARYLGQLPDQQPINLQITTDLRSRLQTVSSDLERSRRNRRELSSEISGRLNRLQAERAELLKKYTPQYSEVKKKDAEIAQHMALLDPEARSSLAGVEDLALRQIKASLDQNAHELEDLEREESTLRSQIGQYQSLVSSAPLRELELAQLNRDYDLLKKDYESLKAREIQSGLTADLEEAQQGEQFRLIEPPGLPLKPIGPNRLRIGAVGVVAGLALGFALAFFRESLDPSFQSEWAVKAALDVPLVVGIPMMLTPGEQARRRGGRVLGWLGATALIMVVIGAEVYLYSKS